MTAKEFIANIVYHNNLDECDLKKTEWLEFIVQEALDYNTVRKVVNNGSVGEIVNIKTHIGDLNI